MHVSAACLQRGDKFLVRLGAKCLTATVNACSEIRTCLCRLTIAERLDLLVPGLNLARGLPLMCDATVVSPISRNCVPRGGSSNQGGRLLEQAERTNNTTYHEVINTGLGSLPCLGCEVYSKWSSQCIAFVPALARERCRGMHPRIRRGAELWLQHRWWGVWRPHCSARLRMLS